MTSHSKGTAAIAGSSAGIGAVYADRLARRGYDLLLVARNQERLEHLAKAIARDTGRKVELLAADLMNPNDLHKVEQRLRNDNIHQQELGNGYLVEYANNLGLDMSQFLQNMSKQVHIDRINEDIESGLQSGVTATPAVFINGIRYRARWNIEQLMAAIVAANH